MPEKTEQNDYSKKLSALINTIRENTEVVKNLTEQLTYVTGAELDPNTGKIKPQKRKSKKSLPESIDDLGKNVESSNKRSEELDQTIAGVSEQVNALSIQTAKNNKSITGFLGKAMRIGGRAALYTGQQAAGVLEAPSVFDPKEDLRQIGESIKKSFSLALGGPVTSYVAGMVGSALKSAIGSVKRASSKESMSGGYELDEDTGLPKFKKGGVVPGRRGDPKLVIAHGGEIIIPTSQKLSKKATRSIVTSSVMNATKRSYGSGIDGINQRLDTLILLQNQTMMGIQGPVTNELLHISDILNFGNNIFRIFTEPIQDSLEHIKEGIKGVDMSLKGFFFQLPKFLIKDVLLKVLGKEMLWNLILKNVFGKVLVRGVLWETLLKPSVEAFAGRNFGGGHIPVMGAGALLGGMGGAMGGAPMLGGAMGAWGSKIMLDYWKTKRDIPFQQLMELKMIKENVSHLSEYFTGTAPGEFGFGKKFKMFAEDQIAYIYDPIIRPLLGISKFMGITDMAKGAYSWTKRQLGMGTEEPKKLTSSIDVLRSIDFRMYQIQKTLSGGIVPYMEQQITTIEAQYEILKDEREDASKHRKEEKRHWLYQFLFGGKGLSLLSGIPGLGGLSTLGAGAAGGALAGGLAGLGKGGIGKSLGLAGLGLIGYELWNLGKNIENKGWSEGIGSSLGQLGTWFMPEGTLIKEGKLTGAGVATAQIWGAAVGGPVGIAVATILSDVVAVIARKFGWKWGDDSPRTYAPEPGNNEERAWLHYGKKLQRVQRSRKGSIWKFQSPIYAEDKNKYFTQQQLNSLVEEGKIKKVGEDYYYADDPNKLMERYNDVKESIRETPEETFLRKMRGIKGENYNPSSNTSSFGIDSTIGLLSSIYETSKDGWSTISRNVNDKVSYGMYQMIPSTMNDFLRSPEGSPFRAFFEGADPGSPEFDGAYLGLLSNPKYGENFKMAMFNWLKRTHMQPAIEHAKYRGIDVSNEAIRAALGSMGIQHKDYKSIIDNAKKKGGNIIDALYESRKEHVQSLSKLTEEQKKSITERYNKEKTDVLNWAEQGKSYILNKYPEKSEEYLALMDEIKESWKNNETLANAIKEGMTIAVNQFSNNTQNTNNNNTQNTPPPTENLSGLFEMPDFASVLSIPGY